MNWDLRLTEENGISNLYMCHDGQPVQVSLSMEERTGSKSADIPRTATEPVTLHVLNGDVEVTLDVPARFTHQLHIDGVEDEAEPYLSAAAHPLGGRRSLDERSSDANAADYVVFSTETDESIDDGLRIRPARRLV